MPPPPDLDAVRADTSAASVVPLDESTARDDDEAFDDDAATVVGADIETDLETRLVGVMDPTAAGESPPETIASADMTAEEQQPVAAAAGSSGGPASASRLLRTISTWTPPADREDRGAADAPGDQTGSDRKI